ncbi:DUF3850 domain-containing protein [Lactococcus garvieae]|uniref:DUF3850 domain-containing protein n=1 Tax=Lactococcus garvieae TaxID=1363 RepID=UPI0038541013
MKTHELKLDVKYFEDVKSGKKNFEMRNNDRDFQVGDILELKAYVKGLKSFAKWGEIIDPFNHFRMSHNYMTCAEEDADTIKVRVTTLVEADRFNKIAEIENGKQQKILNIQKVIKDYFHEEQLPDGYVVLGIEVVK